MAVTRIEIKGKPIGIVDLEDIFEEVRSLGIGNDENLKDALLSRVREKNYVPSGMVPYYKDELLAEYRIFTGEAQRSMRPGSAMEIRLYGASCFRCETLDQMIKDILSRSGIKADYLLVSDIREVAMAGIMSTPALTVNGRVILAGQVPAEKQLEELLFAAIVAEDNP